MNEERQSYRLGLAFFKGLALTAAVTAGAWFVSRDPLFTKVAFGLAFLATVGYLFGLSAGLYEGVEWGRRHALMTERMLLDQLKREGRLK
jgi:hypothetical protein